MKRQVVMIDPRKVRDKDLYPEEIARVEFISDSESDIAIVYFDERGVYNAYNVSELLVIYPEKLIFQNLCNKYYKLGRTEIKQVLELVTEYELRNYINAFRIALKNPSIISLCMTDFASFLRLNPK